MAWKEQNTISVVELGFYAPSLLISIFLCIRHGFGRSSGWLYLIIFSLARIIGAALQLATISDAANKSLYIGSAILSNIGVSPLMLVQLGLLSRALTSIRKSAHTLVNERMIRLVQILVIAGLALTITGGTKSGNGYADTGVYTVQGTAKIGMGLLVIGYVLTALAALQVAARVSRAEPGEKRLALVVGLCLPLLFVRVAYAALTTFSHDAKFSQISGDLNYLIGMAVATEMAMVVIIESIGLTLHKAPKNHKVPSKDVYDPYAMGPYQEGRFGPRR